MVAGRRHSA